MSIQSKAAHRERGREQVREQGRDHVRDEVPDPGQQRGRQAASTYKERALYVISVAADLAGVHPQTLRIYERKGLLSPQRTAGNTRRYSERDVERLRQIQRLTQDEGVNLAGVRIIMEMQRRLDEAQAQLDRARRRMAEVQRQAERQQADRTAPRRPHWGVLARLDDVRQIYGQGR
ncbi:MAG: MerR family transcriptional regulator [Actinobacteria bacterium]|nr:MAG: MerR family transcriptional regulator [Actinomycetota bacterium]